MNLRDDLLQLYSDSDDEDDDEEDEEEEEAEEEEREGQRDQDQQHDHPYGAPKPYVFCLCAWIPEPRLLVCKRAWAVSLLALTRLGKPWGLGSSTPYSLTLIAPLPGPLKLRHCTTAHSWKPCSRS